MSKKSFDKILQSQGFGTRKWCRELIQNDEVSINGEIINNYKQLIETDHLIFRIFEEDWIYQEKIYIALNKPSNYECSRKPSHHPGFLELLP